MQQPMYVHRRWVSLLAALVFIASSVQAGGYLWSGTDNEEFTGAVPSFLGVHRIDGNMATPVPGSPFALSLAPLVHLNGIYATGGYLTAGNPQTNTMSDVNYIGAFLTGPTPVPVIPNQCCNEDMALDMRDNYNVSVWHAYFSGFAGRIDRLQVSSHNLISSHPINDVVGITIVDCDIWITQWAGRAVGTFDPTTNTFTPVFFTPTAAGGLAFDPTSRLLWVGLQGGNVTPYTLTGAVAGPTFQPFGPMGNTVDGLEFVADEVTCCDRLPFASVDRNVTNPPTSEPDPDREPSEPGEQ